MKGATKYTHQRSGCSFCDGRNGPRLRPSGSVSARKANEETDADRA